MRMTMFFGYSTDDHAAGWPIFRLNGEKNIAMKHIEGSTILHILFYTSFFNPRQGRNTANTLLWLYELYVSLSTFFPSPISGKGAVTDAPKNPVNLADTLYLECTFTVLVHGTDDDVISTVCNCFLFMNAISILECSRRQRLQSNASSLWLYDT